MTSALAPLTRAAAATASLLAAACGAGGPPPAASPSVPAEVRTAPTTVAVGGITYTLEAELGRDVMPRVGPGPSGGSLSGQGRLRPDRQGAPSATLRPEAVWVLAESDAWETVPVQAAAPDGRSHLSFSLRDGPPLAVGRRADVVLRFEADGRRYLVRAAGVEVIGYL